MKQENLGATPGIPSLQGGEDVNVAAERERIGLPAVLRALNVAISEARHAQQQDELGKLEAALKALGGTEKGSVIVRSDEKEAGRG